MEYASVTKIAVSLNLYLDNMQFGLMAAITINPYASDTNGNPKSVTANEVKLLETIEPPNRKYVATSNTREKMSNKFPCFSTFPFNDELYLKIEAMAIPINNPSKRV